MSPWETLGDVVLVDSSFAVDPPQGHLQVLMTTAPTPCLPTACPDEHPQNYSGTDAADRVFVGFLGLTQPSTPGNPNPLSPGRVFSGIRQTFTTNTPILLTFTWQFLTDESDCGALTEVS